MMSAECTSERQKLQPGTRRFSPADLMHLAVRLCPAAALFGLAFTADPLLQWLSLLGFVPLALAFLPGIPGGCAACRTGSTGSLTLPPAH